MPYMLILGEKEMAGGCVSVRARDGEEGKQDLGAMKIEEFVELIKSQNII